MFGILNNEPGLYSFSLVVELILADQIDKFYDLEQDVRVRLRSIERFQKLDYFRLCKPERWLEERYSITLNK